MSPPVMGNAVSVLVAATTNGRKRPRKNSTRACDDCKARKVRCDGTQPCGRCTKFHANCTYESKYTRGSLVMPMRSSAVQTDPIDIELPPIVAASTVRHAENISGQGDANRMGALLDGQGAPSSGCSSSRDKTPPELSLGGPFSPLYPQISSTDGPTSSDSSRLGTPGRNTATSPTESEWINSDSSYPSTRLSQTPLERDDDQQFWFSESPMGEVDSKYLALPSKKLAHKLVSWYFDNGCPTYRILHRPLLEEWVDCGFHAEPSPFDLDGSADVEPAFARRTPDYDRIRRRLLNDRCVSALIFSVWAMGCQFPVGSLPANAENWKALRYRSQQYLLIAQNELKNEQSSPDMLIKLQAQFVMCQYLLATSRVKEAWDLLVTVKNMANNLNLNRRVRTYNGTRRPSRDRVGLELRKRAFWAIYTLESYMCTMLGRTLTWAEEDITTDWPAIARFSLLQHVSDTDGEAAADAIAAMDIGDSRSQPSLMYSPIAHAKISRIVRLALRKLYRDMPSDNQEDVIDDLARQVGEWEKSLPTFLRLNSQTDGLRLPYSRQADVIHLAHAHALILIYRPSLNLMDGSLRQTDVTTTLADVSARKRAQQSKCLEAAMGVAEMDGFANISGSNWFIAYVAFCAVTVMFVYLTHHPLSPSRHLILQRARKLCDLEITLSGQSNMAKRYVSALKALWHQVQKYLRIGAHTLGSSQSFDGSIAAASPRAGHASVQSASTLLGTIPSFARVSRETSFHGVEVQPGPWRIDPWESGLIAPMHPTGYPGLTDSSSTSMSNALTDATASATGEIPSEDKSSEDELGRIWFGDLLGTLSESFQEFDSAASAGFGQ
ncbi:hypothetical protein V1517DRAFT_261625 [Lipomyces orientalis]|uniref:Uncharacterized protein n=1 Tax=Lipomyces orientalis TaxID=1233043 RepID=A0ACC3TKZ2_9ASCO